eukprot:356427-Chlamydomonas_euryale.AAC.1
MIDVAAKPSAVLRSAVAVAETVDKGNAHMIFRATCIAGPRRRPRWVMQLHKGVCMAQDANFALLQASRRCVFESR